MREPRTEAMRSTTKAARQAETQALGRRLCRPLRPILSWRPAPAPTPVAASAAPARNYRQAPRSNLPRALMRINLVITVAVALAWIGAVVRGRRPLQMPWYRRLGQGLGAAGRYQGMAKVCCKGRTPDQREEVVVDAF